jgi:hypothetical protein
MGLLVELTMEPQDYDSEIGWCEDCGDVELTVFVEWATIDGECIRYTCPACGRTSLLFTGTPDEDELILPPYDDFRG